MKQTAYKSWLAAALDLGSNSFHITIVDTRSRPCVVVCRYGEKVQLGAGLDAHNNLSHVAMEKSLLCLYGMADRMAQVAPENRHIIATNALRVAHNRQAFIDKAEPILQAPVHVVSGEREADLIFAGVLQELQGSELYNQPKLVIDIGGGSTEIICGQQQPWVLNSFAMGCVAYSQQFFSDRIITVAALNAAITAAQHMVQPQVQDYQQHNWQVCVGSSGTLRALMTLSDRKSHGLPILNRSSMLEVKAKILQFQHLDRLSLPGLRPDRGEVLPAGYAIMQGVMQAFDLHKVYFSTGALREGVIARYIGCES